MSKRFGGVGGAKLDRKGVYFVPGEYEVEVKRCEWITARDKEEFYCVETKVLESSSPEHKGLDRNWMPKMNQDMSNTNLKGFTIACLGIEASDSEKIAAISDDEFANALEASLDGPDKENVNAFKGTRLHLSVVETTKKNGEPFNKHIWSPSKAK